MENYIPISFLNDFTFCPRSIYFHQLYSAQDKGVYQTEVQTKGTHVHNAVDNKTYSTRKTILSGIEVSSNRYKLQGKIDLFDVEKGLLTERKRKVAKIYDGFIFQLYAQYFGLIEMGYEVRKLRVYSMIDNKSYRIRLPEEDRSMLAKFEQLINNVQQFELSASFVPNTNKCNRCIYAPLCDYGSC